MTHIATAVVPAGAAVFIQIRPATVKDLSAIADVHLAAFAGFFLSKLGPAFLREYYRLILQFAGCILLVCERDGAVCGLAGGFVNPSRFYHTAPRRMAPLLLALLLSPTAWPHVIIRVLQSARSIFKKGAPTEPRSETSCYLSSLAVRPDMGGQGIGKRLMTAFLESARAQKATEVYLNTDARQNDAVNGFYQRLGFAKTGSYVTSAGRHMNQYEYTFQPECNSVARSVDSASLNQVFSD